MNKNTFALGHKKEEVSSAILKREKYTIEDNEKGEFIILDSSGEVIKTFKEYWYAYEYIESYLQNKDSIDGINYTKGKTMKNNQQGNAKRPNLANNISVDKEQLIPLNEGWEKLRVTIIDDLLIIKDSTNNESLRFRADEIHPVYFKYDRICFAFSIRIALAFNMESANKIMDFIAPNASDYIIDLHNTLISLNENT